MVKLSSLAQLAIDAAGGLDHWRRFGNVSARQLTGGVLWPLKHQQGVLDDARVSVDLRKEWASHRPFSASNLRTTFQPHRVAIETTEGQTVEELPRPRDSFKGHSLDTPWSRLQLAYFAGYARPSPSTPKVYFGGTTMTWKFRAGPRPHTTCINSKNSRGFSYRPSGEC